MPAYRVVAAVAFLAAAGCGSDGLVAVSGRLTERGGGYTAGGDETYDLHLRPAGGGQNAPQYTLALAADGGFVAHGPTGTGVPPGKYEVVFTSRREGEPNDKYKFRYAPGKTPLKLEVTLAPKEQRFTIDLTAGTVIPG